MRAKNFIFTALAYQLLTFPCAFVWHLVVFRAFYERIGYFGEKEPIVALGFLTIAVQGLILAYAYPFFQRGGHALVEGMRAAAIFGGLIMSVHVVAPAAKNHAPATAEWFLFESLYFVIQFSLIGLALAFIHRPKKGVANGV